jgi:hypothetical protein
MKRRAEPASVEDAWEDSSNTIPGTRKMATHGNRSTPKRKRTIDVVGRSKTKSAKAAVTCHSRDPIPLIAAVQKYDGPWPMTILSGGTEGDKARNEIGGYRLRKLFYEGRYAFCLAPSISMSYPKRRRKGSFCYSFLRNVMQTDPSVMKPLRSLSATSS